MLSLVSTCVNANQSCYLHTYSHTITCTHMLIHVHTHTYAHTHTHTCSHSQVVRRFRSGGYNTLVATCVGEEGLDIGEVDLIVCFDAHKSPIRLVQRMGRTGRKRSGRIVVIVAQGKEEQVGGAFHVSIPFHSCLHSMSPFLSCLHSIPDLPEEPVEQDQYPPSNQRGV